MKFSRPAAVLAAVVLLAGGAAVAVNPAAVAAPPQPTYSATLTEGPNCEYTLTATWKNAKIDLVNGIWFLDGTAFEDHLFTAQSTLNGTVKARTWTVHVGPLAAAAETHTIHLLVQFYSNGAHQYETWLELPTNCTRNV